MYNHLNDQPRTSPQIAPPRRDRRSGARQGRPCAGRAARAQVDRADRQRRDPTRHAVRDPARLAATAGGSELKGEAMAREKAERYGAERYPVRLEQEEDGGY